MKTALGMCCVQRMQSGAMRAFDRTGVAVVPSVEEPGSFLYQYRLIASPAVAADLNETLALRWAESRKCRADPGLKFLPMFIGTVADRTLVRSGTLDRFARHQLPAVEDQRQADVPH